MEAAYILYFRVSTARQGASGLGLDAQRVASESYARSTGGTVLHEFVEVESGKRSHRPELAAAVEICRRSGATLLIAKLDRLARNVHFLSGLMQSGVRFVAADMPNADRFMLHIYAAMAEEEGRRISERTRAALAAAKARGVHLGSTAATLARRNRDCADRFASQVGPQIKDWIEQESMTYRAVAARLNKMKVASARGGQWHATTVHRVHHRLLATV